MNNNISNASATERARTETTSGNAQQARPAWIPALKRYERPSAGSAAIQLADTLIPYFALLTLMYLTISGGWPYWATLLLAVPAGGFLVRSFIIFHDCCHGSYLRSKRAMRIIGTVLGVLTFTPFDDWRHAHGIHHSTAGNLDRRGVGDVWTMTVDEYRRSSWLHRLGYRLFRNPLVMFGLGPFYTFLVINRFPGPYATKREKMHVHFTNAAILAVAGVAAATIGIVPYLLIQLPVILIAGTMGIWLFYVQHQFDPAYWARTEEWGSVEAALDGSSFYRLPAVLAWFSANIGLHHIHHLRPRIPNYRLQQCLKENPELQLKDHLTIRTSLKSVRLNLWDEANSRLLSFRELSRRIRESRRTARMNPA